MGKHLSSSVAERERRHRADPGSSQAIVEQHRQAEPALTDAGLAATAEERPTSRQLKQRLMVADLAAWTLGMTAAFFLQYWLRPVPRYIAHQHVLLMVGSLPGFAFGAAVNQIYRARVIERPSEEKTRILRAVAVGIGFLIALSVGVKYQQLSRSWLALCAITVTVAVVMERNIARRKFARLRRERRIGRRILIVGTDAHAIGLVHTYQRNPQLGYEVVGFVGDGDIGERDGIGVVGRVDELPQLLHRLDAVGVVVSISGVTQEVVNQITRELTDDGYHVALSSTLRDIDVTRLRPQDLDGRTLIYVEPTVRGGWRALAKRAFDVVTAATLLVASAPILIAAAVAIKLTSNGPVLFRQVRVGRHGELFRLLKLRTMVVDAEARLAELRAHSEFDGPLFKMNRDPRVTPVGRILRKLSIDELPQLWCVLRGEMSMVGPRPVLPSEAEEWDATLSERLRVLPGVTGLWQVSGRSSTTFEEYCRLDRYYVDNWSLAHDLRICVRTVGVVLTGSGAA